MNKNPWIFLQNPQEVNHHGGSGQSCSAAAEATASAANHDQVASWHKTHKVPSDETLAYAYVDYNASISF